jgi:hypothetical protein
MGDGHSWRSTKEVTHLQDVLRSLQVLPQHCLLDSAPFQTGVLQLGTFCKEMSQVISVSDKRLYGNGKDGCQFGNFKDYPLNYCQHIRPYFTVSNLRLLQLWGQVPIFTSPRNWVAVIPPSTLGLSFSTVKPQQYTKFVFVPHRKRYVSATNTNWLTLFRGIICLFPDSNTQIHCGKNANAKFLLC